jgi:hypothetical protein
MTLIDTPGLGSTTDWLGERTLGQFAGGGGPGPADAVIYLLRHLHEDDVSFLESFHAGTGDPTNSIGVMSRADEIGGIDDVFLREAQLSAQRMADSPQLRRLVHTVVPISGLLAETAATLTEDEYRQIAKLAKLSTDDLTAMCRTVDRFVNRFPELALDTKQREALLGRFGLFGIKVAATAVQMKTAPDSSRLQQRLLRASRLGDLSELVERVFESRSEMLKSRSALLMLRAVLEAETAEIADRELTHAIERCDALLESPAFTELALLAEFRSLAVGPVAAVSDIGLVAALLGEGGAAPWQRLGFAAEVADDEIARAAADQLVRVRRVRADPRVRGALRPVVDGAVAAAEALT